LHSLSSFTDDIGLRREPKGSALPKFPSSVSDGGWFRGYTGSLLRCGLSSCSPPCTDLTRNFPQPTGTFTPELPTSRSPFSSSGITTVATERFHRWDFHPLEYQLASLHRLFHPLLHAGLARRTVIAILRQQFTTARRETPRLPFQGCTSSLQFLCCPRIRGPEAQGSFREFWR
jgi:hypothetical protein